MSIIHNLHSRRGQLKLEASKLSWASVEGADYYLLYCNNAALTMPKAVTEIDISSLPGGKADMFAFILIVYLKLPLTSVNTLKLEVW